LSACAVALVLTLVAVACSDSSKRGTVDVSNAETAPDTSTSNADQSSDDGTANGPRPGRLKLLAHAKSAFDPWTEPKDEATWATMRSTYDAMIVYSPYFDTRAALFPNAFVYIDMYALKVNNPNETIARDHPEWVLRTADGSPVYIPWGCDGRNGCPQYAADVGNPAFQDHFVGRVRQLVELGYTGIHVDDVNLAWRLSDVAGNRVTPLNPRTGNDLTLDEWRRDAVKLLEHVRTEFPDTKFIHNSIWFADSPSFDDPLVSRQISAADVIMLERGANDVGLVQGDGEFGFASFIEFIDRVHRLGANVLLLDQTATTEREQVFNLVTGLLTNDGGDYVSTEAYDQLAPESLWVGFETDLGAAAGPHREADGVWQRDFERGRVVLNEPGRDRANVDLGGTYVTLDGRTVSEVSLDSREAIILRRP
jgi:hypothetical protein